MKPTPFQNMLCAMPDSINLMLVGGRGGGKSGAIKLLVLSHCHRYGEWARPLIVRETYKAASELEFELLELFKQSFGRGVRHNGQEHAFSLPNGAKVEIGCFEKSSDYVKFQGRSYTMLVIDEFGEFKNRKWANRLRANLRSPNRDVPLREIRAANPGGIQHTYINRRFIGAAPEGEPFEAEDQQWVWISSTFRDNPHMPKEYEKTIRSSCFGDEALAQAWVDGNWNINRGAMFGDVLSEKPFTENGHRLNIKPPADPDRLLPTDFNIRDYRPFISMDWGSARPSVVYLALRSRGEGMFRCPPGSLILLDEIATCTKDDLNEGLRWPPGKLAEEMHVMCKRWGLNYVPHGIGDDAYGLDESLLQVLARERVYLVLPNKTRGSRVSGWNKMRELFCNARERNGKRGMWVNARCTYFWETVPDLSRDPDREEDIISDGPDHGADAARYAVLHNDYGITQGTYLA